MLNSNLKEVPNFIRMSLSTMRKSELKRVGDNINDFILSKPLDFPFFTVVHNGFGYC